MIDNMGLAPNRYQTLLFRAMIYVIVSVLAAVVVGIGAAVNQPRLDPARRSFRRPG